MVWGEGVEVPGALLRGRIGMRGWSRMVRQCWRCAVAPGFVLVRPSSSTDGRLLRKWPLQFRNRDLASPSCCVLGFTKCRLGLGAPTDSNVGQERESNSSEQIVSLCSFQQHWHYEGASTAVAGGRGGTLKRRVVVLASCPAADGAHPSTGDPHRVGAAGRQLGGPPWWCPGRRDGGHRCVPRLHPVQRQCSITQGADGRCKPCVLRRVVNGWPHTRLTAVCLRVCKHLPPHRATDAPEQLVNGC